MSSRLAIVNKDKCKIKNCSFECMKSCPVNRSKRKCITIESHSTINEYLCIGCGACEKACPFNAIKIINLPNAILKTAVTHRFLPNGFCLYKMPLLKENQIITLIGANGSGKSTICKILTNQLKPNLNRERTKYAEIIKEHRGTELMGYFKQLYSDQISVAIKEQYIDQMRDSLSAETVGDLVRNSELIGKLRLEKIMQRKLKNLSGGELQRVLICHVLEQDCAVRIFDEPTSFLDITQRVTAAHIFIEHKAKYNLLVDHDLAILDLIGDSGSIIYGQKQVYGNATSLFSMRNAINIFIDGYIPTENLRFRDSQLNFVKQQEDLNLISQFSFPAEKIEKGEFSLRIEAGEFRNEIILLLGENGMGKSTFLENFARKYSCSLKLQLLSPKFRGTVKQLFMKIMRNKFLDETFFSEIIKPLDVHNFYNKNLCNLSGGELQRVAIVVALGREADFYLIDEPSAYLDSEQRCAVCRVIRRFTFLYEKPIFFVEHDLMMATYLANKVILFEGTPGIESTARAPCSLKEGMNIFLKRMNISFRRDKDSNRPRVNKRGSQKDREQKESGNYYI